jgi:hypothetical protein
MTSAAHWARLKAFDAAQDQFRRDKIRWKWIVECAKCCRDWGLPSAWYEHRAAEAWHEAKDRRRAAIDKANADYREAFEKEQGAEILALHRRELERANKAAEADKKRRAKKREADKKRRAKKREADKKRRAEQAKRARAQRHFESTLEEIAEEFGGVTRQRILQIEAKALRKLRHPKRSGVLKHFVDRSGVPDIGAIGGRIPPRPTLEQLDAMPPGEPEPEPYEFDESKGFADRWSPFWKYDPDSFECRVDIQPLDFENAILP